MIIFSYKISDIIDNAQVLSLYRSNSMLEKGSENTLDDTAVSDEDESLLKKYLKSGCSLIADILSGYTKDLINSDGNKVLMVGEPFEFDVTHETVAHSFVFRVNMPETFSESVVQLIDDAIKDALENYVLYRVAKLKMIEAETYFSDWENSRSQIRGYINRRTKSTVRNYNNLI